MIHVHVVQARNTKNVAVDNRIYSDSMIYGVDKKHYNSAFCPRYVYKKLSFYI